MKNLVLINGTELQVKEFRGHRVVTFRDIDTVHERVEGTAKRNFNTNKPRFVENMDYFFVKPSDVEGYEIRTSEINNAGTYLITESGYLMLVKSLTDDLAWKVQRELVNNYFRVKDLENNLSDLSPQLQLLINMELNQKRLENQLLMTQNQVSTIKDTIVQRDDKEWRKEIVRKLRKIGFKQGKYDEVVKESYRLLEERAGCKLKTRLENLRQRMALEGATKTAINNANYLDVIGADKRLKEIYISIVNQMYVKYAA